MSADGSINQSNESPASSTMKKHRCPSKAWKLRPLSLAPLSKKQPSSIPPCPLEQPPTFSTAPGATTSPATSPYLPKRQKTSCSKTTTSAPPSVPPPTASYPPSTAALPSMTNAC